MFPRFFNRQPQREYCIIARLTQGTFMQRFLVKAASPYEACRKFDTSGEYAQFTRVSGATIPNEF